MSSLKNINIVTSNSPELIKILNDSNLSYTVQDIILSDSKYNWEAIYEKSIKNNESYIIDYETCALTRQSGKSTSLFNVLIKYNGVVLCKDPKNFNTKKMLSYLPKDSGATIEVIDIGFLDSDLGRQKYSLRPLFVDDSCSFLTYDEIMKYVRLGYKIIGSSYPSNDNRRNTNEFR